MGYRAAELGMEALGIPVERAADEEIVCVAENDACGADCVQYMLSCTVGKGNLVFRPSGKMAYSFFDRRTGKSVRILFRQMDRTGDRETMIRTVLTAPKDEVVEIKAPLYGAPEKARHFDSIRCDRCGEFCREDKIRLSLGERHCSDCYTPYDR
jgi:formylmethanofuran dehydrogenase subunit E